MEHIFLMNEQKIFFTFSMRSVFCGLNFRMALLLIGCTKNVAAQLLWWDVLNPTHVSYLRKKTLISVYSNRNKRDNRGFSLNC